MAQEQGYSIVTIVMSVLWMRFGLTLLDTVGLTKGEKKQESETEGENWHRVERSYGTWLRRVEMPQPVDAEKVAASYDGGVLTVTVAKAEEIKPRTIEVKTNGK